MESTGMRDRIQISQSTADLLVGAGKEHWIKPRENTIEAKGKGSMQTYWLSLTAKEALSSSDNSEAAAHNDTIATESSTSASLADEAESKEDRLVDWMVELLAERLRPMVRKSYNLLFGHHLPTEQLIYYRSYCVYIL
jgi:Adenylate and Guanylate cyclase catalytic domain